MTFYIKDAVERGARPSVHSSLFICNECYGDGVRIPLATMKEAKARAVAKDLKQRKEMAHVIAAE